VADVEEVKTSVREGDPAPFSPQTLAELRDFAPQNDF
jgi:hypothetical protein